MRVVHVVSLTHVGSKIACCAPEGDRLLGDGQANSPSGGVFGGGAATGSGFSGLASGQQGFQGFASPTPAAGGGGPAWAHLLLCRLCDCRPLRLWVHGRVCSLRCAWVCSTRLLALALAPCVSPQAQMLCCH